MTTLDDNDPAFMLLPDMRAFIARFRKQGTAYQDALAELSRFVQQAERLATLYEERSSHLDDVIEERNRYHEEAKTLRAAIAHRFTDTSVL